MKFSQLVRRASGAALFAAVAALSPAAVLAEDLVLGQVGPFTVLPVNDAVEVNQGIKAYVAQANKAGGIKGRKISFFELDDRYSPDGFAEKYNEALEKKPVALLSPIGSASLAKALGDKLLDKGDVLVVNAIPGVESFRNPGHPKLFHVRAGDRQQIEKLVQHARTLGMTKLALLYQDIPMGTSGVTVAQAEAQRLTGIDLKGVKAGGTDAAALDAAAQQVAQLGTHGTLIVGAPRFSAEGVAALRKAGVRGSVFVLSYVPTGLLVKAAGVEGARGVGIAQTFPNPNGTTLPLHRDFRAAMKASFPDVKEYTAFHLEGYLSARVVGEAVKRSKDPVNSPAALSKALQNMGELDFGGFRVNFSEGNVGSRFVDIGVVGGDGKLKY